MIPLEILKTEAESSSEQRFVQQHPAPALVVDPEDEEVDLRPHHFNTVKIRAVQDPMEWMSQTQADGMLDMVDDLMDAGRTQLGGDADDVQSQTVVFAAKREGGNPFGHMITIGRVPNNDIVFSSPSVSKVHAYLHQDDEGQWWMYDQRSTNGTWVDGKRVQDGDPVKLEDGSWINLGPSLGLKFLHPKTLYAYLRGLDGKFPAGGGA